MSHPNDPFAEIRAELRLEDLPKRDDSLPINLSIMMSTCYRYSQLQRSLECLVRQDWKEFEVLICDDGDSTDLTPIFQQFEPYLRIKTTRREKPQFSVDPTGGFLTLFLIASGEYWAIMQPELMLYPEVCRTLYEGHLKELPSDKVLYNPRIGTSETLIKFGEIGNRQTWVTIKPFHLSPDMTRVFIDKYDWHTSLDNLKNMPNFWDTNYGLSYKPNSYWATFTYFPFWFCASGHKDAGIFRDMPTFRGHAMIDFYTMGYRRFYDYVDVIVQEPRAFHQDHFRQATGVPGEFNDFTTFPVPKEWL